MENCTGRSILISLLLAVNGMPGLAQTNQESVMIGGHEISLGMPVDRALAVLREEGKVQPVVEVPIRHWIVYSRQNEIVAVVNAEGTVVAGVTFLLLGHSLDSTQDMFDAIFAATSKLKSSSKGEQNCEITTSSDYDPNGESSAVVHFYCGRSSDAPLGTYRIELRRSLVKGDSGAKASFEVWGKIGDTF